MCRLMFVPASAKVSRKQLLTQMHALVKSCGGDGNGMAHVSPTGDVVIRKGAKLSAADMVDDIITHQKKGNHTIWHTRKVSVGWVDDSQCHPFEIKGRKMRGVLAHNGTWRDGAVLAHWLGCGSDTAALARMLGKFGAAQLLADYIFPSSGVFLIADTTEPGEPEFRAIHKYGDLEYCQKTGIYASEFSLSWQWWNQTYSVREGTHNLLFAPSRKQSAQWVSTAGGYKQVYSPIAKTETRSAGIDDYDPSGRYRLYGWDREGD